ncbi:HIT-like protein [Trametopsis cervina]|nr:HIT-like protein [Trametopsis cervina]
MTSFVIKAHEGRRVHTSWSPDSRCAFCRILQGEEPAFRVFENDMVFAILDILPLRPGHTLVIPKIHVSRVSELPKEYAAAIGDAVTKVANALTGALQNTALNIVCNQEYAQAVPHVHYHVIPAPRFGENSLQSREDVIPTGTFMQRKVHRAEYEARHELDDDDAVQLVEKIKARL